jgi:lactoylglutathione lyase
MSSSKLNLPSKEPGAQSIGLVHVAISLGSQAAVDELTKALRAKGVPVLDGPRKTGDGYYESVVLDPEGNRVEITA